MTQIGTITLDQTDAQLLLDVEAWGFTLRLGDDVMTYDPRNDEDDDLLALVDIMGTVDDEDYEFEKAVFGAALKDSQTETRDGKPPLLAYSAAYKFDDLDRTVTWRAGDYHTVFLYGGEAYETMGFAYDPEASQFGDITFSVGR